MLQTKDYKTFQVGDQMVSGAVNASRALPGDTVEVENGRVAIIIKRADHRGLVGVLEVAAKTRYGFTKRGAPVYLFTPWNEAYPQMYVGSTVADTSKNLLAIVDFLDWEAGTNLPRGDCREVLGPCGDLATEETALIRHACAAPWKLKDVGCLADRAPIPFPALKQMGTTFHVDPPGCRDIDDAVTLVRISEEELEVHIHIADVATLLAANPWLYKAATLGQTLYRDGAVVAGMLPTAAEAECSLLPFQTRGALTLVAQFHDSHILLNTRWVYEEVKVTESYTYETIAGTPHAVHLRAVATALKGSACDDPHEWIEQLMLFYNAEAAKVLRKAGQGLLRRHPAPDWELLSRLEGYQQTGVPTFLAYRSGEYCAADTADVRHWGLDTAVYCHASSPIRRWADCVNQTALLNILFGAGLPALPGADAGALNLLAKRSKAYERDLFFVRSILAANVRHARGVVLDVDLETKKAKVWVPDWQRVVTARPSPESAVCCSTPGQRVSMTTYYDAAQRNWKRRMVIGMHLDIVA
jgi:exoribonuclease R